MPIHTRVLGDLSQELQATQLAEFPDAQDVFGALFRKLKGTQLAEFPDNVGGG